MNTHNTTQTLNQKPIDTIVLDMDGTLYMLQRYGSKDKTSSYKKSELAEAVKKNAIVFLAEISGNNKEECQTVINELIATGISLSLYFKKNYLIERDVYFDRVWDIDPNGKIVSGHKWGELIVNLRCSGIKVFLLTSAPRIWQRKVFEVLNIQENNFNMVHTAENHLHKWEILEQIIKRKNPKTIISIGDQFESDIAPALERGCQATQVTNPQNTWKILNDILKQSKKDGCKTKTDNRY